MSLADGNLDQRALDETAAQIRALGVKVLLDPDVEAAQWARMILGFSAIGAQLCRRRGEPNV